MTMALPTSRYPPTKGLVPALSELLGGGIPQGKRLIPPLTDDNFELPLGEGLGSLAGAGGRYKRSVFASNHRFVDSLLAH